MPLAGLVTASARLLRAMVDALVAEKGGTVAAGHTDSAHIIANEMGGPIECDVRSPDIGLGGHIAGRGKTSMHALSRTEIEEICQTFRPLNLCDPALILDVGSRQIAKANPLFPIFQAG